MKEARGCCLNVAALPLSLNFYESTAVLSNWELPAWVTVQSLTVFLPLLECLSLSFPSSSPCGVVALSVVTQCLDKDEDGDSSHLSITCPCDIGITTQTPVSLTYAPTVTDDGNSSAPAICNPPSGSTFHDTTTVTCSTTDSEGSQASCTFTVTFTVRRHRNHHRTWVSSILDCEKRGPNNAQYERDRPGRHAWFACEGASVAWSHIHCCSLFFSCVVALLCIGYLAALHPIQLVASHQVESPSIPRA